MITWLKYPENKPEKTGNVLVWVYDTTWAVAFWCDGDFTTLSSSVPINDMVTHFTEINPPQIDIVQPSTEGC